MSKGGVAKLGRKFSANIGEKKNRSDEDNFLILKKKSPFLPNCGINSDVCIFITRRNIFHFRAHGL